MIKGSEHNEERCAASYVAARIGLLSAIPVLEEQLQAGLESPHVEFAFKNLRCSH
ncbi:hypothetical protein GF318_01510 [Candidatus Micrarchaeota archaeon]|nr:hypothetical protein [Candidatus Micrarchaeota archaeon]